MPTIAIAAATDVGRVRQVNEDAYLIADLDPAATLVADGAPVELGARRILLGLSDGMGGHAAGEVASALALDSLLESLRATPTGAPEDILQQAVAAANTAVNAKALDAGKHGMGATLTAVLAVGAKAYIAEVGDSRAYLLRAGAFRQLTRDQSLVQALVDGGALTEEQAKSFPQKNVILQAIGPKPEVTAVITQVELAAGDTLLVCCDGVSNAITFDELADVLRTNATVAAAARLIALANERGGADNLTAIVATIT